MTIMKWIKGKELIRLFTIGCLLIAPTLVMSCSNQSHTPIPENDWEYNETSFKLNDADTTKILTVTISDKETKVPKFTLVNHADSQYLNVASNSNNNTIKTTLTYIKAPALISAKGMRIDCKFYISETIFLIKSIYIYAWPVGPHETPVLDITTDITTVVVASSTKIQGTFVTNNFTVTSLILYGADILKFENLDWVSGNTFTVSVTNSVSNGTYGLQVQANGTIRSNVVDITVGSLQTPSLQLTTNVTSVATGSSTSIVGSLTANNFSLTGFILTGNDAGKFSNFSITGNTFSVQIANGVIASTYTLSVIANSQYISNGVLITVYDVPEQSIEDFVNLRTFSVAALPGDGNWYRGTAWIINKSNNNKNDFQYWIATNMHVTIGVENATWKWWAKDKGGNSNSGSYVNFSNFALKPHEDFVYDASTTYPRNDAIDLSVANVTFPSVLPDAIRNNLNALNDYWDANNHHLNTFVQGYEPTTSTDYKVVAGYPCYPVNAANKYATWTYQRFNDSQYHYGKQSVYHSINQDWSYDGWIDQAPQYWFEGTTGQNDVLGGGASGSMMINTRKEICGIYWGKSTDANFFYPSASIFNSTYKNFLSNYQ